MKGQISGMWGTIFVFVFAIIVIIIVIGMAISSTIPGVGGGAERFKFSPLVVNPFNFAEIAMSSGQTGLTTETLNYILTKKYEVGGKLNNLDPLIKFWKGYEDFYIGIGIENNNIDIASFANKPVRCGKNKAGFCFTTNNCGTGRIESDVNDCAIEGQTCCIDDLAEHQRRLKESGIPLELDEYLCGKNDEGICEIEGVSPYYKKCPPGKEPAGKVGEFKCYFKMPLFKKAKTLCCVPIDEFKPGQVSSAEVPILYKNDIFGKITVTVGD